MGTQRQVQYEDGEWSRTIVEDPEEVDASNSPTLAVVLAAQEFGYTLSSLEAAVLAEAAIASSGLRHD